MGYSPWGCKESDMTEQLTCSLFFHCLSKDNNTNFGRIVQDLNEVTHIQLLAWYQARWKHWLK